MTLHPRVARHPKVVALGGGHGLAASLSALGCSPTRSPPSSRSPTTAAPAGRLREEFDVLPPGDLRMALAALCDDTEWGHTWRDVLQHRFAGRGAARRATRSATSSSCRSGTCSATPSTAWTSSAGCSAPGAGCCRWRPSPARDRGRDPRRTTRHGPTTVSTVRGQHRGRLDAGAGAAASRLHPAGPAAVPTRRCEAIRDADWVILGPRSWFTSVMPHLLVPGLARRARVDARPASCSTSTSRCTPGRPTGSRAEDHLEVLAEHAPELRLDVVLADPSVVDDAAALRRRRPAGLGAELVVGTGRPTRGQPRPPRLAAASRRRYRDILG